MKNTLKIISICVGIIGLLTGLVLGCVYFESISEYIKDKIDQRKLEK